MNNLHFITCFCLFPPKNPVFVDTVIMLDLQSPGCLMGTYGRADYAGQETQASLDAGYSRQGYGDTSDCLKGGTW